jgi:hypothetical protein
MSEPPVPDEPGRPAEHGVREREPDPMQLEAARLLANDARATLHDQGFDDDEIERWAITYVAEHGAGDVEGFLAWIDREQDD